MTHSEDKKIVDLFAKTVLLKSELAEAIRAQDRLRMAEQEGHGRSSKKIVVGLLILFGVVVAWIFCVCLPPHHSR
jgi:hypothetical protein